MVLDVIKFSLKLTVVMVVVVIFGFMGMTLLLGAGLAVAYQLVAGLFFIAFTCGLIWDNATRWGERDLKAMLNSRKKIGSPQQLKQYAAMAYYPAKGFLAGTAALLVPLILTVIYTLLTFHGWEKPISVAVPNLIYNILYILFMPFTSILRLATPHGLILNPTSIGIPYITLAGNANFAVSSISQVNMILPYMFFIPIFLFIVVSGICYNMGYNKQKQLLPEQTRKQYFDEYDPDAQPQTETQI